MQAHKPRDFPAGLSPWRSVAASPVGGDCRNAALCPPAWTARGRGHPCSFFVNLQGLYSRLPAQAGYGDKWPS